MEVELSFGHYFLLFCIMCGTCNIHNYEYEIRDINKTLLRIEKTLDKIEVKQTKEFKKEVIDGL